MPGLEGASLSYPRGVTVNQLVENLGEYPGAPQQHGLSAGAY